MVANFRSQSNMVSHSQLGKHAVVLGGGMAGLLTTRILTEHFEQVSLIERDHYPEEPVFRPGVPQSRHFHILLARGQQIIEELFPGIQEDLVARGAIESDLIKDYRNRTRYGWCPRVSSPLRIYAMRRVLLEWQVRQALVKSPQIRIIDGHEVVNLVASEDAKSVIGVSLRARLNDGGQEPGSNSQPDDSSCSHLQPTQVLAALTQVTADLIVDATGRESKACEWLKSLGYAPPAETIINPFLGYVTQIYAPPSGVQRDWKGMIIAITPPENLRTGIIMPNDEGHWMVALGGAGKDYPPHDTDAFLEFGKGLPDPAWFEAMKEAQPISSIYGYRKNENRIRHFERLQRQPERFLVIGDAVCALNPVYGQGMTIAALGALELRECLRQYSPGNLSGLARRFQRKLARLNTLPWSLATSLDLQVPGVEGGKMKQRTTLMDRYLERVLQRVPVDPYVASLFLQVVHMLEAPTALFKLSVIMKVIFSK
jgi:2-polyprenyl-6-methoxyphenol hydroxylase-like FAD-dependent oxidoreductase